jgi:hypothetical protein
MTLIGSKRLQQSVFEALASSNRAAGSGGGTGLFQVPQTTANTLLGQAINSGASFTTITGSLISLVVARPTTAVVIGYVLINYTAGAAVTATISPFVDSVQTQAMAAGPASTVANPVNVPICYSQALGVGTHTIDLRVATGAGAPTYNVQAFSLTVILFG